jgi:hypothetical protein
LRAGGITIADRARSGGAPSREGCSIRTEDQGPEGEEMTARTSRPWTEADEERLRSMVLAGASPGTIAQVLDRTIDSVRVRANRLRIPLKTVIVKRS